MKVMRGGREIKEIERPLHVLDGRKAVVFRRKLWELRRGNRIVIDEAPLGEKGNGREKPSPAPKITGTRGDQSTRTGGANGAAAMSQDSSGQGAVAPASGAGEAPKATVYRVATVSDDAGVSVPADWDPRQREVIEAPQDARLLVDAGPGTGKTAVACRRVAWLIDECDVAPANIWLVSFTRTAVREIRNRIRHYLQDPADVFSVKVATIDSHAWAIHSGFDSSASLTGTYEENIRRVTELVGEHQGVFEYLAGVEHLIVEEAQDIVGARADLLMELIRQLPAGCGVTVFADEAQAIYGFADEDGHSIDAKGHLPERIREHQELGFGETALSTIYRTDKEQLLRLFTEVREKVLARDGNGDGDRLERIKDMVRALADDEEALVEALDRQDHEALRSTFVLFRRRIDALTAAAFWDTVPHRLRMSGLPTLIEPWLGALLWDCTEKRLKQGDFERLWTERVEGRGLTTLPRQDAWALLVKTAGETRTVVSTQLLRSRLGRASPPNDFVRPDFGLGGPVFGTIHGCKGREADSVLLMLPNSKPQQSDEDEEARVVFVGATRAKMELRVGKGFPFLKARRLQGSGRVYALKTKRGKPQAQVEFGRAGDLGIEGVAGRSLFRTADEVVAVHEWLLANADSIRRVSAKAVGELDWRYRVVPEGGPPIGFLAERVNSDLFEIGRDVQKTLEWSRSLRPDYGPEYLKTFGASTLVLHPDDPQKDLLHEPWATSGFVLAPVVQGFAMIYFKTY